MVEVKKIVAETTYDITGLTETEFWILCYGLDAYRAKEQGNGGAHAKAQYEVASKLRVQLASRVAVCSV